MTDKLNKQNNLSRKKLTANSSTASVHGVTPQKTDIFILSHKNIESHISVFWLGHRTSLIARLRYSCIL